MLDDTFLPFHSLVAAVARDAPATVAVSTAGGPVTYAELDAGSNRIARLLLARGLRPGERVVVGLPRGAALVTCALGIWKAGGVYVPVDVDDASRRTVDIVTECGAALVLWSSDTTPPPSTVGRRLVVDPDDAAAHPADDPGLIVSAEDAAYVIHTSGSSGRPKGVVVGHAGLANLAHAQREVLDIGAGDRVLQFAAVTFDASIAEFTLALAHGASLCVYPREELTPGEPLAGVLRESITHAIVVPSVLAVLTPERFPRLRLLGVAGEDCPAELVHAWAGRHRLTNLYGVTECAVWSTYAPARVEEGRVPIGRPVAGTAVRVVDPDLRPVPPGAPGELLLGGVGVAQGYLDRPELTAERFVGPLGGADGVGRWYRTGDLVRELSDGSLLHLGRLDDQVQIRGQRVEPGEVEAALTALPGIRQAIVVAHAARGEDRRLVAYVVPEPGHSPVERDTRRALSERLPTHLVPSIVVTVDAVPLTAHGKADRAALAARVPPPRPAAAADDRSDHRCDDGVAPDGVSERAAIVAALMAEVLHLPAIGIHDNFFDQGGHSLSAADLLSHVHRRFGVHVGLGAFFIDPTADGLAEHLDGFASHSVEGRRPA
ncbi:non-ribosomal peptide synthetase [Embleya hyalina]|uniref:Non-ribosomal peptide synthetase n=1 Tax=Embleya hyalina TaxID=516124 RepID=A0A401YQU1_9ACTN|nr:non-ribosomal peptide synthetase [Embleya hyalina]GCD96979.1 non-ribosomal peptide synthetase [Embleya hyalina]